MSVSPFEQHIDLAVFTGEYTSLIGEAAARIEAVGLPSERIPSLPDDLGMLADISMEREGDKVVGRVQPSATAKQWIADVAAACEAWRAETRQDAP